MYPLKPCFYKLLRFHIRCNLLILNSKDRGTAVGATDGAAGAAVGPVGLLSFGVSQVPTEGRRANLDGKLAKNLAMKKNRVMEKRQPMRLPA